MGAGTPLTWTILVRAAHQASKCRCCVGWGGHPGLGRQPWCSSDWAALRAEELNETPRQRAPMLKRRRLRRKQRGCAGGDETRVGGCERAGAPGLTHVVPDGPGEEGCRPAGACARSLCTKKCWPRCFCLEEPCSPPLCAQVSVSTAFARRKQQLLKTARPSSLAN